MLYLSYSSEAVMRLDCQILLKSPPPYLTMQAGSAPGSNILNTIKFFSQELPAAEFTLICKVHPFIFDESVVPFVVEK